jgi:tetratricopeptide (TPR) repeat protein
LALRRHRLPRFWLGLTLGLVVCGVTATYLWERQLPDRLRQASRAGDLDACLRYSEQLAALRWLGGQDPGEQARCRRLKARQLWQTQQWERALQLQLQLINSQAATINDRLLLQSWEDELQQRALRLFHQGDLNGALALLEPIGENHKQGGNSLGDNLREVWNSNRYQQERARKLAEQKRWWEAIDALNRIDHPWWKQQSLSLRRSVEQGVNRLSKAHRDHDSHGSLPHTVSPEQLDAQVRQRIDQGIDEWTAFQQACRSLGGQIVEAGPETACRR